MIRHAASTVVLLAALPFALAGCSSTPDADEQLFDESAYSLGTVASGSLARGVAEGRGRDVLIEADVKGRFYSKLVGRLAAEPVVNRSGAVVVDRDGPIDAAASRAIEASGIRRVLVRSSWVTITQ
jgi:hypothetical protein